MWTSLLTHATYPVTVRVPRAWNEDFGIIDKRICENCFLAVLLQIIEGSAIYVRWTSSLLANISNHFCPLQEGMHIMLTCMVF